MVERMAQGSAPPLSRGEETISAVRSFTPSMIW